MSGRDTSTLDAVAAATGGTRAERSTVTDGWGGPDRTPPDITARLRDDHGIPAEWSRSFAIDHARGVGRRSPSETLGGHGTSVQRTVEADPERLFRTFRDEAKRRSWLGMVADRRHSEDFRRLADEPWRLLKEDPPAHLRFRAHSCGGPSGSTVDVRLEPHGEGRTQVSVQHDGLASEAERVVMRAGWSEALDALMVHFAEGRDY